MIKVIISAHKVGFDTSDPVIRWRQGAPTEVEFRLPSDDDDNHDLAEIVIDDERYTIAIRDLKLLTGVKHEN